MTEEYPTLQAYQKGKALKQELIGVWDTERRSVISKALRAAGMSTTWVISTLPGTVDFYLYKKSPEKVERLLLALIDLKDQPGVRA